MSTDGDPVSQARAICLDVLARAPRTREQLTQALARRDVPEEIAEAVLDELTDGGLIDDAAFAVAWVETRHAGRSLARRALSRELRRRGVAEAVVDDAVGRVSPEQETRNARDLAARRLPATRGLLPAVRLRRVSAILVRRGYPLGMALAVVRAALEAEGQSVADDDVASLTDEE